MAQWFNVNTMVLKTLLKKPIIIQIFRFLAIGFLNTALDFVVLNMFSEVFGVTSGWKLGGTNMPGFLLAIVQSYYWNRYWTFTINNKSTIKDYIQCVGIGSIGAGILLGVFIGSKYEANTLYYFGLFSILIILQCFAWIKKKDELKKTSNAIAFTSFFIVSFIGLLINSGLVSLISQNLINNAILVDSPALVRNSAKAIATVVSLFWNFLGYKLIVFKKH